METSNQYCLRCAEIIKADPKISEQTILIMFLNYGKLVLQENKQKK